MTTGERLVILSSYSEGTALDLYNNIDISSTRVEFPVYGDLEVVYMRQPIAELNVPQEFTIDIVATVIGANFTKADYSANITEENEANILKTVRGIDL